MKKTLFTITLLFFTLYSFSIELNTKVFDILDLEYKGLENVKQLHLEGKDKEALTALLDYYRNKKDVNHTDIDLNNVSINKDEQQWADEALEHKFFVHTGFQPSFFYGEDIDWQYWPVKDNELRWQLHRTKWWEPMGKAFFLTKDEKYAKAWTFQYMDWIKKNPLLKKSDIENPTDEEKKLIENVRFAWRPLEVSHRIESQTIQFLLFLGSNNFTAEFLSQFLVNYHKNTEHILNNYSDGSNHLLFEAQRVICASAAFPELKDANKWRASGIEVLNREIVKQVYDDDMHYELDPHYHLMSIDIFAKAIRIADGHGFRNEFPQSYLNTVEEMISLVYNYSFPDYSNPLFSDAREISKESMLEFYNIWKDIFPNNEMIKYMATERQEGKHPEYLSNAFKTSGYYVFRNGWDMDATQMTVKAGPPAFWHNQPDNGTFELYVNGRNFFPDSGSFVYAGDKETNEQRDWFRQTMVHKTLTLDNKDLEVMDSKCLLWNKKDNYEVLVYENPSYKDLSHRRSVFFVDQKFFVILDEAFGDAKGEIGVHYQMCEGDMNINLEKGSLSTLLGDDNNISVQAFSPSKFVMQEEEGWVSYHYREKHERKAVAYTMDKKDDKPMRIVTLIEPTKDGKATSKNSAKIKNAQSAMSNQMTLGLKIDGKKYELNYQL